MTEAPCSKHVRDGRLVKAKQFLLAAGQVKDLGGDEEADAYVTLCVHAGIAAADVICCARLGRTSRGDNHNEAIALLERAGAKEEAKRLAVLLGLKSKAGYAHEPSSKTDVTRAGRAAKDLVAAAERA